MRQFKFECKKMIKKKTSWVATLLSFTAILGIALFHFSVTESVRNGNISKQQNMMNDFQTFLEEAETDKKIAEEQGATETVEELEANIERYEQSISTREKWITQYTKRDWHPLYQDELEDLTIFTSEKGSMYIEEQPVLPFTLKASLAEKEWLDEKGIAPYVQNTTYLSFLPTIYDQFTGKSLTEWEKMTTRYGETGLEFLYKFMPNFYVFIAILVGCFIFGNTISSESRKKRRGLQFHFVQPVRKSNVFIAKYTCGFLYTLLFMILMLAAPLIGSLFDKGVGDFTYPVLVYEGAEPNPNGSEFNALDPMKDEFHFIPMSEYVGKVLLMGVVLSFFTFSIYFLLSLAIKSPAITVLLTGALTIVGMKISPLSTFNPFTYADIHRVLNGEIATLSFNPAIGFQSGIITLFAAGCIVLLIGFVGFNVKSRRLAL